MATTEKPKVFGVELAGSEYRPLRDVVGAVETSNRGNVTLRIGREIEPGSGWQQVAYIVLSPAEVVDLARALITTAIPSAISFGFSNPGVWFRTDDGVRCWPDGEPYSADPPGGCADCGATRRNEKTGLLEHRPEYGCRDLEADAYQRGWKAAGGRYRQKGRHDWTDEDQERLEDLVDLTADRGLSEAETIELGDLRRRKPVS